MTDGAVAAFDGEDEDGGGFIGDGWVRPNAPRRRERWRFTSQEVNSPAPAGVSENRLLDRREESRMLMGRLKQRLGYGPKLAGVDFFLT